VGPASGGPSPPVNWRVRVPLWVELDPREHHQRSANDRVAALRGAEDERHVADGGAGRRRPVEGIAVEEGGRKTRDREDGEDDHGRRRKECDKS
jgi:hypothetical protein